MKWEKIGRMKVEREKISSKKVMLEKEREREWCERK